MTWVRQFDQLTDRLSDRLNPLLLKELRQAFKGRLFVYTFGLLLLGAWCVSVFGITTLGDAIQWHSSPLLLSAYVILLQVAVLVLVPMLTFRSMQAETEANTWELICITTLSSVRLVSGKLSCGVVLALLLTSVIAPCLAFCSLLPGFDWIRIAIVFGATIVLSLLNTIFSVMLSSVTVNRYWQTFAMIGLLVLLATEALFVCATSHAFLSGEEMSRLAWMERLMMASGYSVYSTYGISINSAWLAFGALFVLVVAYFYLFFEVAVSQVTFEADSRSGRIRLTCSLLYVLQWVLLVMCDVGRHYGYYGYSRFNPALELFIVHWAAFGLSACLEPETISTRIRRRLSGWSRLRAPFLPGGSRALVFLLLHLGATPIIAWMLGTGPQIVLWSMYLLLYITLAVAICRSFLAVNPMISRASLRLGVVITIAVSTAPPLLLGWLF